jgi:DNA replication protein DnaC
MEWIDRHENLCVCGPSGTGKSHFCEALGQLAIDTGRTVAWFSIEGLGALLRRHDADDSINKTIRRPSRFRSCISILIIGAEFGGPLSGGI